MVVVGYLSSSLLNLPSSLIDSTWSPCGDASRAFLIAVSDIMAMIVGLCCWGSVAVARFFYFIKTVITSAIKYVKS